MGEGRWPPTQQLASAGSQRPHCYPFRELLLWQTYEDAFLWKSKGWAPGGGKVLGHSKEVHVRIPLPPPPPPPPLPSCVSHTPICIIFPSHPFEVMCL